MSSGAPTDDAYEFLKALLQDWGLEGLFGNVKDMLIEGVPREVVPIKLRETPEYQKRFAANLERQKKGLSLLTEAEFLATESSLVSTVRRFVGEGVYDTRDFTDRWMSADVSPQELTDRLNLYADNFDRQPQWIRDAWAGQGLTRADAIKAVMDTNVTAQTLRRKMTAVGIAGEAARQYGASRYDDSRFEAFADAGVSAEDAREGFGRVAAREQRESLLGSISGTEITRDEQESAELLGDESAAQKRRKVLSQEKGRFEQNYLAGVRQSRADASGSY
jgi:hypothetical protein